MDRYSKEDRPQLQWAEDMIDNLLLGVKACFVVFVRAMRAAWSPKKLDD